MSVYTNTYLLEFGTPSRTWKVIARQKEKIPILEKETINFFLLLFFVPIYPSTFIDFLVFWFYLSIYTAGVHLKKCRAKPTISIRQTWVQVLPLPCTGYISVISCKDLLYASVSPFVKWKETACLQGWFLKFGFITEQMVNKC